MPSFRPRCGVTCAALLLAVWSHAFAGQLAPAAEASRSSAGADPQQPPAPAQAESPGELHAFARAVAGDFWTFPQRRSTWVMLAAGAGAAVATHPIDDTFNARLSRADGFFAAGAIAGKAWVQMSAAGALYGVGRFVLPHVREMNRQNRATHLGLDLLRAQLLSQAVSRGLRYGLQRDRPTGECCSLPSGHAVNAFAAASVLERHFGYRAALPTLVLATYVAASRLHDNRHFASDVVFGSAVGHALGWTVVGGHGRDDYAIAPVLVPGGMMLAFTSDAVPDLRLPWP